jgi:hypothetical protein
MNKRIGILVLGLAATVALSMTGCEDSDLTAPTDGLLELTVNPSGLTIDPDAGESEATAQVIAALFNADGKPLQGVAVLFSTGSGALASNGKTVKTNASGIAIDTLTVTTQSAESFQVRAQSSAIITTADVTVQILEGNEQPLASILETPTGSAQVNQLVTFDGSTSLDPDGSITCYQWTVQSNVPASDEIIQGPAASSFQRTWSEEQILSVVLRVSDRADAGALCTGQEPVPEDLFSPKIDSVLNYVIECENIPPVADAGQDQDFFFIPNSNPLEQVTLNGTLSSDPDGQILRYEWECGGGVGPNEIRPGVVVCQYEGFGEWNARLTVFDNGNPPPGQTDGPCKKSSSDTTRIRFLENGTAP